ncbi:MAG: TolC family outer membrane protein [Pseudomonadales bacterium]
MITLKTGRLTLLFLSLFSLPLQAANLTDIVNQAIENDAVILAARSQLDADSEVVPQSRSTLLPNLGLTANTRTIDRETSGGTNNLDERFNSNGYTAQLTQPLFRADRWFTLNAAKASKKQAAAVYAEAQQELMLRIATAYFNILRSQDNLSAAVSRETAFGQQLEQANERFKVGLIAATDVYEAQAGFDLAKVERISSQEARYNSFNALERLTNQSYQDIDLLDRSMPVQGPSPSPRQSWIDSALLNSHQLAAQKHQLAAVKQQLRAEKSGHLPTLDATATYTHSEDGGTSFLGSESDTKIFALELTLPLFEGGNRSSKIREAHYRHEQAKQDYENIYRQIREQIQTQHRTVTTDVLRIKAQKAALKSSDSALEATEGGYEVGTRNIVDVLQAQNNTFNARRNYSNALYDYIINLLTLKRLAGILSQADLEDLNLWLKPNAATTTEG